MKKPARAISSLLLMVIASNSLAAPLPASRADLFRADLARFQATIDAQDRPHDQAISELMADLRAHEISLQDAIASLEEKLSVREIAEFRDRVEKATRGIDPTSLSPGEVLELLAPTLLAAESEGLSWSQCRRDRRSIGVALLVVAAGLVAFSFTDDWRSTRYPDAPNELLTNTAIVTSIIPMWLGAYLIVRARDCEHP